MNYFNRGQTMKELNKKEAVKNIMALLDSGKTVYINGGYLWIMYDYRAGHKIIKWRNFGESAIRRTLKDLIWLLNTIFDCKYRKVVYSYRQVKTPIDLIKVYRDNKAIKQFTGVKYGKSKRYKKMGKQ